LIKAEVDPAMPKQFVTVLVLDANQRSALAVTRSLGKLVNVRVLTADMSVQSLAGQSRYSSSYHQHPSIYDDGAAFSRWLIEFTRIHHIDWLFPTTEISSQSILRLRSELHPCQIPFADLDKVMTLANKWSLIELAETAGVPYPRSRYFTNSTELNVSAVQEYPIIVKPCLSRIPLSSGWMDSTVHVAADAQALTALLQHPYLRDHPFMLQEFIAGHGAGVFALYHQGEPITFFAHQRLREKPPRGGVSVLSQSATLDSRLLNAAKTLLDAAKWHGVAMVEFRVAADGTPYLMEVNTRFWGSLQLAIDAGVDFPALLLKTNLGEAVKPLLSYRIGQRLRWLLGDLDSLYLVLRDGGFSKQEKLKRLIAFFTPNLSNTRHEINRWEDLGPAWFELKSYIKALKR
jgi:predicted ATP-grasp superfamily ATP-dependent carboligase